MSSIHFGPVLVINQTDDLKVLAELVSGITFDALKAATNTKLTPEQYEGFIDRMGKTFMDAGLLNEDMVPTGKIAVSL